MAPGTRELRRSFGDGPLMLMLPENVGRTPPTVSKSSPVTLTLVLSPTFTDSDAPTALVRFSFTTRRAVLVTTMSSLEPIATDCVLSIMRE